MGRYSGGRPTYNEVHQAYTQLQQLGDSSALDRLIAGAGKPAVVEVWKAGPEPPTFLQRLQAGFASDPLSEAQIYQAEGVPASDKGDEVV